MNVKTLQITCVTHSSACVTFQNRGRPYSLLNLSSLQHAKHIPAFLQLLSIFMVGTYLQSSKSQSKEKENQFMKGQIA